MKKILFSMFMLFVSIVGMAQGEIQNETLVNPTDLSDFKKETITVSDLSKWSFYGLGKTTNQGPNQFCIAEDDETKGVMIVSPKSYGTDVILKYKAMTLTSASVMVVILSASDQGESEALTIPTDYDGNMGFLINSADNYFFAFRNAPHGFTPFLRKYPEPGAKALASAKENVMVPGVYYDIEVGRMRKKLWLKIDGEPIFETEDENMLAGGHIAFRTRGTAGLKAACLIKELTIYVAK